MKRLLLALLLILVFLVAVSCGGKAADGPSAAPDVRGHASVRIAWPVRTAASRVVPLASNSILIQIKDASGNVKAHTTIVRPNATWTSPSLAAGAYILLATAYPTTSGTGNPDAAGTGSVTIVANSTVTALAISPATLTPNVGDTTTLAASATDAAKAIVLVDPSTVHWTSSNPAVATVDATGLTPIVKAVAAGTATISAQFTEVEPSLGQTPVNASANVAVTVSTPPPGPATSSWPTPRGATTNTGVGTGSGATGNVALWTASTASSSTSSSYDGSVVIGQNGNLYASTGDGKVVALSRTTGSQLWSIDLGSGISGLAATSGNTLYACNNGTLYALDASNGTTQWSFAGTTNGTNEGSYAPTIDTKGIVYFADTGGNFYAISGGVKKWSASLGNFNSGGITSPKGSARAALGTNGLIYVGGGGKLYALQTSSGATAWTSTGGASSLDDTCAPVVASNGNVYLADDDGGMVYALSGTTGAKVWSLSTGGEHHSIAVQGSSVYVADLYYPNGAGAPGQAARAFALSASSGAQLWTTTLASTNGPRPGTPTVSADGTVYVPGGTSLLYAVSGTGALEWTHNFPSAAYDTVDTMAVDSDGTLYISIPRLAGSGSAIVPGVIYAVR